MLLCISSAKSDCLSLVPADNKELSPLLQVGWEESWKKKEKLVGWQFNRTAKEANNNNNNADQKNIQSKETHCAVCSHPMPRALPSSDSLLPARCPHLNTKHDITWYRIPCLFGQLG